MGLKCRHVITVVCFYHGFENASFVKYWKIADYLRNVFGEGLRAVFPESI